ncbi:hypothetical protein HKBW3S09_01359 [Candidatus Hakubella thermalkaliphila]|uniref:Uncharacterized protein n=1 Tax=Candidatus Hakubella thermalkaliphila TaxID=2754717 RepID=A0A6V8Q8N9_9ACTN|nr:hypothetical protein HKBW3S09_01359 [Candidatus Hakubella thermalkaliphila]GFP41045.1 hypothetical protein HKBW3C_00170 [Candidatus Hakubella thermalkaliphila]
MVEATRQTLAWPGDANSQAVTNVNPDVASSHRPSRDGGTWECRASFPKAKADTSGTRTGKHPVAPRRNRDGM